MKFTDQQKEVITTRHKNILVSAAAGSGKTSVLVERIISMITDKEKPVDIDRFLIVTFTNAAASEMRERIHARILKGLEENPADENLQKQSALIHNAQITTIDSYCLFLLRNHFHEIGLDPAFRVGDPGEIKLIEKDVLEETLEEFYALGDEEFIFFTDAYCPDGKDGAIEKLVEGLYKFSMSHPWPKEWLSQCRKRIDSLSPETIMQTEWMQFAMQLIREKLETALELAQRADSLCDTTDGPYMYADAIEADVQMLSAAVAGLNGNAEDITYEKIAEKIKHMEWKRMSSKKDETVSEEKKELVKKLREKYKKLIKAAGEEMCSEASTEQIVEREKEAGRLERMLIKICDRYIDKLAEAKKEKNVLDFSDIEHYALEILIRDGKPTKTAEMYRDYYKSVMIDEYQDSNMVQELLLASVSTQRQGECNRFMVGDMKQSIYRFRMARPEIFMEKYETYKAGDDDNHLICLKQNFRSRSEVLESTNAVFRQIMIPQIGGVVYDDEAALYPGADYEAMDGCETEICLAVTEEGNSRERRMAEAYMIADKIKKLKASFRVGGRPLEYRDIAILLRSGSGVDEKLKEILISEGIPAHVTLKAGYFSATEISLLMDLLKVVNNPYGDIPFTAVATSMFFGVTNEELALITAETERGTSVYERFAAVVEGKCEKLPQKILAKAAEMLEVLKQLRDEAVVSSMTELVNGILSRFHYVEYVAALPAGAQRKANVEMFVQKTVDFEKTSYHGLFHFLRYMEQLKKYEVDFGEAATLTETADVVRIMTIHKSKGLEFPVCFVAGMDKKYNLRDTTEPILLDADWGVAANLISPAKRTVGKTMRKTVLSHKMKRDSLGEELRVLYVAMTRAREKLILTGALKEEADIKALENEVCAECVTDSETLPVSVIETCSNALDHMLRAWVRRQEVMKLSQISEEELQRSQVRNLSGKMLREEKMRMLSEISAEEVTDTERRAVKELEEKFSYVYPHEILGTLYTKTSVSELKHAAIEEEAIPVMFETEDKEKEYLPAFMRQNETLHEGASRGSAVHRVLELLDFSLYAQMEDEKVSEHLKKDVEQFVAQGRLSEEYARLLFMDKIARFLKSETALRMAKAQSCGKLFKEQPFVISVGADRINEEFPAAEKVLVQGIVDVYFEEADELVIVDYKTDRVSNLQELKDRYRTQLDYYEEAIGRLTGKKVKEKVLYSFVLEDTIGWSE